MTKNKGSYLATVVLLGLVAWVLHHFGVEHDGNPYLADLGLFAAKSAIVVLALFGIREERNEE